MLSHHEISTLLLVQRSPAEVKALGFAPSTSLATGYFANAANV
jgi:hypothetical protein